MQLNPPPGVLGAGRPMPLAPATALLLAVALLAPFLLYFGTVRSIVSIWNSSETFAHGYIILPISLWLIWRRRDNFALYPPQPYAPALVLLGLLGAGWLAAQLGEVQVVSQYMFVAMFPVAALALLGPHLAGSLAFPLLFLLFAVPFGEVFVAPLIDFTANFTVWAVRATGIPVLRSGTRFELPTGNWSVVEACSGVRYLISSITLGCLYAYLTYRSLARRALFIGLSIVVPIIANGMRAYMIVMIGHLSSMQLATGVDHIIYGWLFFGLVMFLMFWIGSYWREDTDTPRARAAAANQEAAPEAGAPAAVPRRLPAMVVAVLVLAALWPAAAMVGERANDNPAPVRLDDVAVSWPQAANFSDWHPYYMTPDAQFRRSYKAGANQVALNVLYYRNQNREKTLISSLNRLTGYKDAWHDTTQTRLTETIGGQHVTVRETVLRKDGGGALLVWDWMHIGGHDTTSNVVGKLWQMESKALLRGDDGAAIMLSAPLDENPDTARAALRAFLKDNLAAVNAALAAAHGVGVKQ